MQLAASETRLQRLGHLQALADSILKQAEGLPDSDFRQVALMLAPDWVRETQL